MEYLLLAKVGMVISGLVKSGYVVAGGYFVKTAMTYYNDYKDSIANEKG
jgi:hypothetical protein